MKNLMLIIAMVVLLVPSIAGAQFHTAAQVLNQVNGAQISGCTQTSVDTTGHNRSGPYNGGTRVLVYGYDGSAFGTGDALRCAWGTSSVDVTSLAGSKVGEIIFANQARVFLVKNDYLYISCISESATMKYDVCPME